MAAKSLSKDVQKRNVKKVEVNAKVTFLIWILECVANLCIVVVWFLVYGRTTSGLLTLGLLWYFVILPYTHVMNTSANKDRILDDGCKNAFRNAFILPLNNIIHSRKNRVQRIEIHHGKVYHVSLKARQRGIGNKKATLFSTLNAGEKNDDLYLKINQLKKNGSKPFVVSRSEDAISTGNINHSTVSVISHIYPSTSNETNTQSTRQGIYKEAKRITSELERKSNKRAKKTDNQLRVRKTILHHMVINVYNEQTYLFYFRQLLQMENSLKKEVRGTLDFNLTHMNECKAPRINHIKRSSGSTKHKKPWRQDPNSFYPRKSKNILRQNSQLQINFRIPTPERICMRLVVLENYDAFCNDDELYSSYLNGLIDLEESLIIL